MKSTNNTPYYNEEDTHYIEIIYELNDFDYGDIFKMANDNPHMHLKSYVKGKIWKELSLFIRDNYPNFIIHSYFYEVVGIKIKTIAIGHVG